MLFKVIIKMFCGSAWAPFAVLGHCKNEHPDIKLDSEAWIKLEQVIKEYQIVSDIQVPKFHGSPVEGLKEHKNSLICLRVGCSYACHKPKVMAEHWTSCHPNSPIPKEKRAQSGVVQCFFPVIGTKYFAVNSSLADVDPKGLYATFIHDYVPSVPPLPMLPPNTHQELPPLLAHTGWNLHLDSFVTDDTKRKTLFTSDLCYILFIINHWFKNVYF